MEKIKWDKDFRSAYWNKGDRLRGSPSHEVFTSILKVCDYCQKIDPGWCDSAECEIFDILEECILDLKHLNSQLDKEMQAGYEEMRNDCCQEI